jgi:hypothetical protein
MTTTVDPPTRPDPRTEVDLECLPTERLEHEMLSLAGHLAAATCSFLRMVGEYDARRSWESWECLSCAHWLNWRCGVGMVAAREQVRVARRLRVLPLLTEAFARGELSYSKVRAITRVALPGTEANLVDLARWSTASQLERACSALRRCSGQADADLCDEQDRAELRRSLTWSTDLESGDLIVRARIPAGAAAESFRASIDAQADAIAESALAPDDPAALALECRRLDALVDLVAAGAACDTSLAPQPEVVVHVTAPVQAAAPDRDAPAPRARHDAAHRWPIVTQHDQHLPWSTLGELCCDGGVRSVLDLVDGDGLWADLVTSLDLDRHRRFPGPALRRAVHRRDRGCCRFPGCARRHRLHVHHIVWWERGGRTELSNLLLLCPQHHRAVHRGVWSLTGTATDTRFRRLGEEVPDTAPPMQGRLAELIDAHDRFGLDIAADGAGSHWQGDHIDWACFFAANLPFDHGPDDDSAEDPVLPAPSARTPGTGTHELPTDIW